MTEGGTARRSPARVLLLGVVLLLMVVAGGLALREFVAARPTEQVALRVTRDIGPLEVLRPDDVVRDDRVSAGEPLATDRQAAVGRYLLGSLRADDPLPRRLVGPASAPDLAAPRIVLASGGSGVSLNGRLVGGDRVDVLFTPRPPTFRDVPPARRGLVLDVQSPRPEQWLVTLAVDPAITGDQLAGLASGDAYLVKLPG